MRPTTILQILTLLVLFTACSTKENQVPKTYISGKYIDQKEPFKIYFRHIGKELDYEYPIYLDSTVTNDSGEFFVELKLSKPLELGASSDHDFFKLYIEPGDSIYFESDADYRTTLTSASGVGSEKVLLLDQADTLLNFVKLLNYDSVELPKQYQSRLAAYQQLLVEAQKTFSPEFNTYFKAKYLHDNYYYLSLFPVYIKMYKKHVPLDSIAAKQAENDLIAYMKKEPESFDLRRDLFSLLARNSKIDSLPEEEQVQLYYQNTVDLHLSDSLTNMLLGSGYLRFLTNGFHTSVEPYLETYKKEAPSSPYIQTIEKELASWKILSKGNYAPNFEATYADSSQFQLSDLLGKVVYIDIWATWCGPCQEEIPHAEKIREAFKDREDVVFLNVSVDSSIKKWVDYVNTHPELGGINVNNPGNFKSQIAKLYKVNGIPQYIIVDKEGKIFTIDAKRPSQGQELIDQLNEALGEEVTAI